MRQFHGHVKDVRNVAFLPDGRIASVGADKTARLWDPRTGAGTVIYKERGPLYALAVAPDGGTVAIAGRSATPDNPVTLFDPAAGKVSRTLRWEIEDDVYRLSGGRYRRVHEAVVRSVWSLAFSATRRHLALAGRKPGGANVPNGGGGGWWTTRTWQPGGGLPAEAYAVRFGPTGETLAVTVRGGVQIFARPGAADPATFPVQCDWAPAVEFLPGTDRAAVAAGGFVTLVPVGGGSKPVRVKTGMRTVTALAATPDGRALMVGGKPSGVEVYDVNLPIPVRRVAYDFAVGGVHGLAMSPDGLTFAVAAEKGLLVCDVEG